MPPAEEPWLVDDGVLVTGSVIIGAYATHQDDAEPTTMTPLPASATAIENTEETRAQTKVAQRKHYETWEMEVFEALREANSHLKLGGVITLAKKHLGAVFKENTAYDTFTRFPRLIEQAKSAEASK